MFLICPVGKHGEPLMRLLGRVGSRLTASGRGGQPGQEA